MHWKVAWFKRNSGKQARLFFYCEHSSQYRGPHGQVFVRGVEYANDNFSCVLKEHDITPSISPNGNCQNNACSKTLFCSLKVERLHGQRFATIREVKDETLA
jgi:putative transposase